MTRLVPLQVLANEKIQRHESIVAAMVEGSKTAVAREIRATARLIQNVRI